MTNYIIWTSFTEGLLGITSVSLCESVKTDIHVRVTWFSRISSIIVTSRRFDDCNRWTNAAIDSSVAIVVGAYINQLQEDWVGFIESVLTGSWNSAHLGRNKCPINKLHRISTGSVVVKLGTCDCHHIIFDQGSCSEESYQGAAFLQVYFG